MGYSEEVHWSRSLGEWSNIVGYEMEILMVGVYTTAKTFAVENFKHGRNHDMVVNMTTLLAREFSGG